MMSDMAPVIVVLDDYPHTRALREATAGPDGLDCRYVSITPIFAAFARMVRRLEFDICELAGVTTEPCHVEHYREPRNVERVDGTVGDLLRDGQVTAAILAPTTPGAEFVPVIPDAETAGREWVDRHGTIPANHLVVVRSDALRQHQETVSRFYQALRRSIADTASERPATPRGWAVTAGWSDSLARCLELAGAYALEQGLLRSRPDIGEMERECAAVELA